MDFGSAATYDAIESIGNSTNIFCPAAPSRCRFIVLCAAHIWQPRRNPQPAGHYFIISSKSHIFLVDSISSTASCALLFVLFYFSWIKSSAAAAECRQNLRERKIIKQNRQGREARAVEIHQKMLVSPVHVVILLTDSAQTVHFSFFTSFVVTADARRLQFWR